MNTYESNMKSGHPVLGIILAVVGIAFAILSTLATGVIGGGIAVVLGIAAVLLGIHARKSGRGTGAIVVGVIAVILAVIMMIMTVNIFTMLRKQAEEAGDAPLVVRYADKPYLGIFGMALSVPNNEAEQKEFTEQMNLLVKRYGSGENVPGT